MSDTRRSLEQLGAAVGVMLSLAFVGLEIRQNTRINRAAAVQAITTEIVQWQTAASQNDHWIRILGFLENGGRYEDLSPEDVMRYRWVVTPTERFMEARFVQAQLGVIREDDLFAGGGVSNKAWFQSPHFLAFWASRDQTQRWSPEFIEFMETEILELRPRTVD